MRSRRCVTPARVLPLLALVLLALASAVAANTLLNAPADVDLRAEPANGNGPRLVDSTHLVPVSARYCHVPGVGSADRDVVVRFTVPDAPAWAAASVLPDRVELTLDPQRACTPFVDVTLLVARTSAPPANATGNVTVLARAPPGTVNAPAEETLTLLVSATVPAAPAALDAAALATEAAPVADAATPARAPLTVFALVGTLAGVGVAAWWTRP